MNWLTKIWRFFNGNVTLGSSQRQPEIEQKTIDLDKLYPKWNCGTCGDWFHMPYKYCKCEKDKIDWMKVSSE